MTSKKKAKSVSDKGTVAAFQIDKDTKKVETLNGFTLEENGQRVYSPSNKPSAADTGALATTGGTLNGRLRLSHTHQHLEFVETDNTDKGWFAEVNEGEMRFGESGISTRFKLLPGGGAYLAGQFMNAGGEIKSKVSNSYRMADGVIGTFWRKDGDHLYLMRTEEGQAESGGFSTHRPFAMNLKSAKVTIGNGLGVKGGLDLDNKIQHINLTTTNKQTLNASGVNVFVGNPEVDSVALETKTGNATVSVGSTKHRIYHGGFKPTADDVGAIPTSQLPTGGSYANVVGKLAKIGTDGVMEIGRYIDMHVSGSTKDYDMRIECQDSALNIAGGELRVGGQPVYHKANKPTTSDIGAVAKTGDTMTGELRLEQASVFPYVDLPGDASTVKRGLSVSNLATRPADGSYPTNYSTILNVNGASMDRQFQMSCDNSGDALHVRASHGGAPDPSKWYPWRRIYHTGFKPTAADTGAIATLNGEMDGALYHKLLGTNKQLLNAGSGQLWLGNRDTVNRLSLQTNNGVVFVSAGAGTDYRVYHEGFKPTVTDVGALKYTTYSGSLETLNESGMFQLKTGVSGHPSGAAGNGDHLINQHWDSGAGYQIYTCYSSGTKGKMFTRNKSGGVWQAWRQMYDSENKPTVYDIEVSNPLTKDVETLSDVINSLKEELASLRAEVQILRRGTLES